GCPIERVMPGRPRLTRSGRGTARTTASSDASLKEAARPSGNGTDAGPVSYASDVATILHRRCVPCHRPGQVAPFSLLTYADARRWATSIGDVIADGRMPPWHAEAAFGHFANDRSLTAREHSVLEAWIQQGTPPGDLAKAPAPPTFTLGWTIGAP